MKLLVQAVPMPTKVLRSNLARGEVYSIQLYVIKCVSDLRQIGGFLRIFRLLSPIKCSSTNKTDTPRYN